MITEMVLWAIECLQFTCACHDDYGVNWTQLKLTGRTCKHRPGSGPGSEVILCIFAAWKGAGKIDSTCWWRSADTVYGGLMEKCNNIALLV